MALRVMLNGVLQELAGLGTGASLRDVLAAAGMKEDRIAVELNGEIAPRSGWLGQTVNQDDRLEVVHFVGGGSGWVTVDGPPAIHCT